MSAVTQLVSSLLHQQPLRKQSGDEEGGPSRPGYRASLLSPSPQTARGWLACSLSFFLSSFLSASGCGAREPLESARSQALIQRDQGADTQKNPTAPQEGAAHFAPACPNLWGSNIVRANSSLINHPASWSFSSWVSSTRYQKAFRKLNTNFS